MMNTDAASEKFRVGDMIDVLKYKVTFAAENPDYFDPDGLVIFVGPQGSGKTLSGVNYVCKLMEMYPECILVTNIKFTDYPIVTFDEWKFKNQTLLANTWENCRKAMTFFNVDVLNEMVEKIMFEFYVKVNRVFPFIDNDDFTKYSNDKAGVIFFIDEIQLYLNSLKSNNVNMDTMTQISQQRKQRKHIVATSQVFGRMAKPLREQFSDVVVCRKYLDCIQYNQLVNRDGIEANGDDMHITGEVKQKFIWTHSPKMYERYDTYYVVERGKFCAGEEQKGEIYRNDESGLSNCS